MGETLKRDNSDYDKYRRSTVELREIEMVSVIIADELINKVLRDVYVTSVDIDDLLLNKMYAVIKRELIEYVNDINKQSSPTDEYTTELYRRQIDG